MTSKSRPVRFLFTRVATAGSAVGAFVSLWAGVAATAPKPASDTETAQGDTAAEAVIEQDGWRRDPAANEWVAIDPQPEPTAAAQPEEQVIVVERHPVVYRYNYVYVPADSPAASGGSSNAPPTGTQAAAAPQPAAPPPEQPAPTIDVVQEQPVYQPPVEEQPALPPPAPAAPPAPAPPPAAPPKPAPTQAPKSTKGS